MRSNPKSSQSSSAQVCPEHLQEFILRAVELAQNPENLKDEMINLGIEKGDALIENYAARIKNKHMRDFAQSAAPKAMRSAVAVAHGNM